MTKPIRILVPVDSQDAEALRIALGYAQKICEKFGPEVQDIVLLVHTKQQLDHTGLSQSLGAGHVKALAKGPISLSGGGRLHAETMKTWRYPPRKSVVVVYYAEPRILDFVDDLNNIAGVVVVPDIPAAADGWVARWGAIIHGQAQQAPPSALIDDPVFVRAIETLSSMINLSTGLGHPRDKAMANEIMRILRTKGHSDQSANIKSWAIRRGWRPDHAADLEALARKIWALRAKPSLSGIHDPEGRYRRWQADS
ncbi:hypothetical protein NKH73_26375 [Mesorhizobium sp. M0938]|uniref:hypothetical protein n=1 Tax=unclassified Mesorhizobium TaxID=325217 RepID=UPI0003CE9BAC|nr:hypothetical protein [Mesorhizobium sp. LNHC252B00]ESY74093.1 hypothetical protein X743_09660 [Mesorhizobium sp. LNHC252B00]